MFVLDGTPREGRVWVARLTLSTALLCGSLAISIAVLMLLSCQYPSLSWLYFLRLRDNTSSIEARFGYLGVCTVSSKQQTCFRVDFTTNINNPTKFLSSNPIAAERRLQPIFTPLLLISMILTSISVMFTIVYRVASIVLPKRVVTVIQSQRAVFVTLALICAWLSYLLAWIAAGIIQQVTTVLSIVAASSFDEASTQYTFTPGAMALAMQWSFAVLVTLYAITITCNLLELGTLRKEYEAGPIIVERRGTCCDWAGSQKSWLEVAGRNTGAKEGVMYWI